MTKEKEKPDLHIVDGMEWERRQLFTELINEVQRLREVNAGLTILCVFLFGLIVWRALTG